MSRNDEGYISDDVMTVGAFVAAILIVLGIFWWIHSTEAEVDNRIQACLEAGGDPIVVGHQYTSEFKACDMP